MITRRECLAAMAALTIAASAQAEDAIPAEVLVVLGNTEGTGVDPALEKLEALRKPPFDSFPKKTLLKRVALQLGLGSEVELELPNGRKLRLLWTERTKEGRLRLKLSINKTGQRDYLPLMTVAAAPGDPFFIAGQKYEGGTLIIGVRAGALRP